MAPQTESVTIKIGEREFKLLDPESLELGEVEQIEDAFDAAIEDIDMSRTKAFRYLIFFSAKRADVDLSMQDLAELKLADLGVVENKTNGASKARPKKAAA